jgi:hypothetical protein
MTVKINETINSTKLVQHGTHENSVSQQKHGSTKFQKRGYVVRRCMFVIGLADFN